MNADRDAIFISICAAYCAMLAVCFAAYFFIPYFATGWGRHLEQGCYLVGDQLIFGATCVGFWGSTAVETLLSLPLALFMLPFGGMSLMAEVAGGDMVGGAEVRRFLLGATGFVFGASLWAPLVYFVSYVRRVTLPAPPSPAPPRKLHRDRR